MLHSIQPHSWIRFTIHPFKYAISSLFVVYIRSCIFSSVRPTKYPFTMHLIIFPLAHIASTICPNILTKSVNFIVYKESFIWALISPLKLTITVFNSIYIVAFEIWSIGKLFPCKSLLFIFAPNTCNSGSVLAMVVCSIAICLIVLPKAFKRVSVNIIQLTPSMPHIMLKLTFIFATICLYMGSMAVFFIEYVPSSTVLWTIYQHLFTTGG